MLFVHPPVRHKWYEFLLITALINLVTEQHEVTVLTLDLMLLDFKYVETFYFVKAYLAAICSTVLQNKGLDFFVFLVASASCYEEEFQTLAV